MQLIKDYMRQDTLRHALNDLTRKTYNFDFERWYQDGYWEGDYIPYSFFDDNKVISNVSVNRMRFDQRGQERNYIQLGTVMTAWQYRNQGCASALVHEALAEVEPASDGVYLFANLDALEFYNKLGFRPVTEYRYTLREGLCPQAGGAGFVPVGPEGKQAYLDAVRGAAVQSALEQRNRFSLQAFYTANLEGVYFCAGLDCYAVMARQGGELTLQSVICPRRLPLEQVIGRIRQPYTRLRLGFAPLDDDAALFDAAPYDGGDDYRLLCRGELLSQIETERLIFPALSHA